MSALTPDNLESPAMPPAAGQVHIGPAPAAAPTPAPGESPAVRPFTGGGGSVAALALTWIAGLVLALLVDGIIIALSNSVLLWLPPEPRLMVCLALGWLAGGLLLVWLVGAVQGRLYRRAGRRWYSPALGVLALWTLAALAYSLLNTAIPFSLAPYLIRSGIFPLLAGGLLLAGAAAGALAGQVAIPTGPRRWQRVNIISAALAGSVISGFWLALLLLLGTGTPM